MAGNPLSPDLITKLVQCPNINNISMISVSQQKSKMSDNVDFSIQYESNHIRYKGQNDNISMHFVLSMVSAKNI